MNDKNKLMLNNDNVHINYRKNRELIGYYWEKNREIRTKIQN